MRRTLAPVLCLAFVLPPALAQGPTKEALKLEKQLNDRDSSVRSSAAWELGQIGATDSVPALTRALGDPVDSVRANAAASLWKLAPASKTAVPALKEALEDRSAAVVANAAGALKKLGVPMKELVPAYGRLLARADCDAAVIGLKALATELPPSELYDVAWECTNAHDATSDTRSDARAALRQLVGRRDRVLVPKMIATLEDLGARDGSDLMSALGALEPPVKEAVPVLSELLDSGMESTRRSAARALGDMGEAALAAVPRIEEVLRTGREPETRVTAAEALGRIGPKAAATAVPALVKAAKDDPWPKVRSTSMTALGEMGPAAKEAVPVLRAGLKDPDGWISLAARNALFRVEPNAREEVAAIADAARPEQKGSLFDDASGVKAALPSRAPEVYELILYSDFAMATAPCRELPSGRCRYTYKGGAVTGPDEGSGDCEKRIAVGKTDFSVVPGIVKQAPGLLGKPRNEVSHVSLSGGIFCKGPRWLVYVKDAGYVDFKLNGKVDDVVKF